MILVKTFYAHNELRNYSYLVLDNETGDSWVIDPYDADPIIKYIKKSSLNLKGILNTHQHFDHIRGNAALNETFKAPVCKLKSSDNLILSPEFSLTTLATPGHTMDHQVFVWKKNDRPLALFSGDTLFNSGVGNCKNGGDVNLLYGTTRKLIESLPDSTLLYPGHDYRKRNLEFALNVEPDNRVVREHLKNFPSVDPEDLEPVTLGEEKKVNPFLRLDSEELNQNLLSDSGKDERELFIKLRNLRDQW